MLLGKRQRRLDDFFEIDGAASDELALRGDLSRVKWIGRGMTRGRVAIVGDVGMHLGASMKGGVIEVTGNVSDWLGAEMTGGLIRIRGNAGGQVGAAYRGGARGMNQGTILIEGSAGIEVGMRMRRGVIAVGGPVRDFAGLQMKGGTIFLLGGAEIRTGAWMARGTIVSLKPIPLLADLHLRGHVSAHVPPAVRAAPRDARVFHSPRGRRGDLPALHGRHVGAGQGRDPHVGGAVASHRRRSRRARRPGPSDASRQAGSGA